MSTAPKLLVIDDEQVVCESCSRIFNDLGYQVEASQDAERGLQHALEDKYQAILLDIRLPGTDGLELLARLRQKNPSVPVIIITGYSSVASASAAMRLGATDYIPKPFTPDEIVNAVTRLVPPLPASARSASLVASEWVAVSDGVLFAEGSWVQEGIDGTVRVGTVMSRSELCRLVRFRPPTVGEIVYRGLPMAAVEMAGVFRVVRAPVTGKVIAVNDGLAEHPGPMVDEPCRAGWVARLEPLHLTEDLKRCAPRTVVLVSHDDLLGRRELSRIGCRVRHTRNAEEAIQTLGATGSAALLVDAVSLGDRGPEVVAAIQEVVPWVKVVVLAGSGSPLEAAYRRLGIFFYAVEPFADGEIVDLLQDLHSPPVEARPARRAALGLPRWIRKVCVINRRGERTSLITSRGALEEHRGAGAMLLQAIRKAALPVQVTLGYGTVSPLEIQREAAQAQRLVVLCAEPLGSLPGSLLRRPGSELIALAGESAHKVVQLVVQPGGGESLDLDARTAEALAEHILTELL